MSETSDDRQEIKVERPKRIKLMAEESLRRMEAFDERKEQFIAAVRKSQEDRSMILIRFPDAESKRRALGFLAGRFSFKSWASGEIIVQETALEHLATEGIPIETT